MPPTAGSSTADRRVTARSPSPSEPPEPGSGQPVFYYDLGNPDCYLVAERVMTTLPEVPEWQPVLGADLRVAPVAEEDRERVSARARELGLLPVRWPARWPPDARLATLVAIYAKQGGRTVSYSLAAFRQSFAGGRDLGEEDTVLLAAAASEMHPAAVLKAAGLKATARGLAHAGARARSAGVSALPAIEAAGRLFTGEGAPEAAAAALAAIPGPPGATALSGGRP